MIRTARQAIAIYFNCDVADVKDCIYQPTRTSIPVYTNENKYYCACKVGRKPATHIDGFKWDWKKANAKFIENYGWQIFEA